MTESKDRSRVPGRTLLPYVSRTLFARDLAYIGCVASENRSAEDVEVFIDSVMLSNGADSDEWEDHRIDWRKQHEIWSHANGLIEGASPTRQDLAAAVMQLQRAVELRDNTLNALYNFTKMPNKTAKAPYPIMADLGIIRPTMKNQLRELRNRLVHEVEEPPLGRDECELLSDTAWYYLKATDRLAHQCISVLVFQYGTDADKSYSYLKVTFNRNDWSARIHGTVSPKFLLDRPSTDCLAVRLTHSTIESYGGHLKFAGEITGFRMALDRLIQMFFDESAL
ncbi:MAG TPA: hypothetical protein VN924_04065 [Bryobacteraceae bacterium]|nr:hypothetical protein [Bryobacteraceae bacterium]